MEYHLYGIPAINKMHILNLWENKIQTQIEEHFTKYLTFIFSSVKSYVKEGLRMLQIGGGKRCDK